MIRILLLTVLLALPSCADVKQKLYQLYQQGDYMGVCNVGLKNFQTYQKDEAYVSLYAFGCLNADQIDRLAAPIMTLHMSEEARTNAAYFSVILMQKNLLMQALYDNKPLKNLKFPTSNHLLSKVFDLFLKNPQSGQSIKEYQDTLDKRLSYKLYTIEYNSRKSVAIDEYYDKILTKHHIY